MGLAHRIGIDIGATKTLLGVLTEAAELVQRVELATAEVFRPSVAPAESLTNHIIDTCGRRGIDMATLEGVAIGIPGVLDRSSQTIVSCPNVPILDHVSLGPHISDRLKVPVFLENDVNLITLGEHLKGRAVGIGDLACVFVGSGIGCGLVLNGHLYSGAGGAAGELGHTIIEPGGLTCTCGSWGCLEMYCSGKALARQAPSILGDEGCNVGEKTGPVGGRWGDAEKVIHAAKEGNLAALEAMRRAFEYLGMGIANLANILNPRLIILGGGILVGWPEGIRIVREVVTLRTRSVVRDSLEIDEPLLGAEAGLYGCCALIGESMRA